MADVFVACAEARRDEVLISRVSATDKEYHFQNWVGARLDAIGVLYKEPGRNTYPDFSLIDYPEGYEVKGLAFPGRAASFDSNSQLPSGVHDGRTVYYVFGRYPKKAPSSEYPVTDLVVCHGDFFNCTRDYVHENKSFKFGNYGDVLVRDRKMYVIPTPFALADGTDGQATLIAPEGVIADERLVEVGNLVRTEADYLVVEYSFNLRTNELVTEKEPNPTAGREHRFSAYRLAGAAGGPVTSRSRAAVQAELPMDE